VDKTTKIRKYLYVKARNGNVYGRIDLTFSVNQEIAGINMQTWINPDGSRNLEYNTKYQKRVMKERMEQGKYVNCDETSKVEANDRIIRHKK
jgi:hypothetical protein